MMFQPSVYPMAVFSEYYYIVLEYFYIVFIILCVIMTLDII